MNLRVAAVEDDLRYRLSLERLFAQAEEFELVGHFGSAESALAALDRAERAEPLRPWDLVLMDLELPALGGIEATRRIKSRPRPPKVVVLTVFEEPRTVLEAISAGADGYLLKSSSGAEILDQLRLVTTGGAPLTAEVARTILDLVRASTARAAPSTRQPGAPSRLDLTDREQQVLRCLARGLAYKQVAAGLDISLDTVRAHVRHVYGKLQVHSVAEAVSRAIRERLI